MIDEIKIEIKSTTIYHTYLMKAKELYKIGFSSNIPKRLDSLKTANPYIELIGSCKFNCERTLHKKYHNKRVTHEWFSLTEDDANNMLELFKLIDIEFDIKMENYLAKLEADAIKKWRDAFDDWLNKTYTKCVKKGYKKIWIYHKYTEEIPPNLEDLYLIAQKLGYNQNWAVIKYNELIADKNHCGLFVDFFGNQIKDKKDNKLTKQ